MKKLFYLLLFVGFAMYAQPTPTGTNSAGMFKMYIPELGAKPDSICVWNEPSKKIKFIPRSTFSQNLHQTLQSGNTSSLDIILDNGFGTLLLNPSEINISSLGGNSIFMNTEDGLIHGDAESHSIQVNYQGLRLRTGDGLFATLLNNDNSTGPDQIYQLPDNPPGTYVLAAGNFIPLSGTETGDPITGNLEITNSGSDTKKIFRGDRQLYFDNDEFSVALQNSEGVGITEVRLSTVAAEMVAGDGTTTGAFAAYPDKVLVSVTDPTSRGLVSEYDFTPNITELDFTQKKYVDDAIEAAGGGIQSVVPGTNVSIDTTDPANPVINVPGFPTNLTYTAGPSNGVVNSDTGSDATITLADGTNAGLMSPAQHDKLAGIAAGATNVVLYTSEGTNIDGTMDQNSIKASMDLIRADIAAIPGISTLASEKQLNQIETIKTGIDYGFLDYSGYTKINATITAGTTKGIKFQSTSGIVGAFVSTGKVIKSDVYSITLTGKCSTSSAGAFGFAIKHTTSGYVGAQWTGSTGAAANLNYNSSATQSGSTLTTQTTYGIGDIISIRMLFRAGGTSFQFAKNGVWGSEVAATGTVPGRHGGEIVLVVKTANTYDDITVKVEEQTDISDYVYVSTTGSDTNDGTFDYPLATIAEAKQRTKGRGTINMMAGDYYDQSDLSFQDSKVRGARGGFIRFISGTRFTSATLEAGYTKVYSVPYATTLNSTMVLWQHDVLDPASLIVVAETHPLHRGRTNRLGSMKMTWLASLAALEASSGTRAYFFWSSGTLYFTITTGSSLATNPVIVPSSTIPTISSGDVSNVEFLYYGGVSCAGNFTVSESSVLYGSGVYGFGYGSGMGGVFRRCRAGGINYQAGTGGDGFNSTLSTVSSLAKYSTAVSYDCWSHDNEDDGDSLHNNAESSIFGGLYEYNGGAGIAAASGGHMSCYNIVSRRNTGQGFAVTGTASDGGTGTNIYASGCFTANNTAGSNTAGSSWVTMTLVGCTSKTGTFTTTGNTVLNCVDIP